MSWSDTHRLLETCVHCHQAVWAVRCYYQGFVECRRCLQWLLIDIEGREAPELAPTQTYAVGRQALAYDAAQRHARHCRACFHPIIDAEGNPGLFGEACASGVTLLREYVDASDAPAFRDYIRSTAGQ